jgi:long-chain acyl-CoA synthetase
MSIQTLNDIFFAIVARDQPRCMLRKTAEGWEPISAREFAAKVSAVSGALRSWGISRGDRVAVLSENRHE